MNSVRAASLVCLVALALASCDDSPVSEDRDTVLRIFTSPSFVTLTVNTEKKVTAQALDRYGEATFNPVTAQACDAKIAVRPDSTLLPIEPPTRVVARGVTAGSSCITFTAGSLTDTVKVVVN